MPRVSESTDTFEIEHRIPESSRLFLFLLSVACIVAITQLHISNLSAFFAILLLFLSGFCLWAAVFCPRRLLWRFDKSHDTFSNIVDSPMAPLRTDEYPTEQIESISLEVYVFCWEDYERTDFDLTIDICDGPHFSIPFGESRTEIDAVIKRLRVFMNDRDGVIVSVKPVHWIRAWWRRRDGRSTQEQLRDTAMESDNSLGEAMKCMECGVTIKPNEQVCSRCGWTWA